MSLTFISNIHGLINILLKDKKGITVTNAFQKILDKSNHKQNKIWVNKGSEFYKRSTKSVL